MNRGHRAAFDYTDHFPLGSALGRIDDSASPATDRRPFGLRRAIASRHSTPVDPRTLSYDEDRQIGLAVDDDGRLVCLARHTDGQTGTVTNNDGHEGRDSDTDHRED